MRNQPLKYVRKPYATKRMHPEQDQKTMGDIFWNAAYTFIIETFENLTENEVTKVFGSRFLMYKELFIGRSKDITTIPSAILLLNFSFFKIADMYEAEVIHKHEEIKQYYENSRSWKITKPLRWIKKLFK